ncbi:MAG: RsmD family RNA methyltransferase [Bacteroidetes bacterium]|nr:RsmD family RNA methyltransferase [Bacteroidota bacterium]
MRIIAGKHAGYKLNQPFFEPTRPTTDMAKEALFSIIDNYFNFENIKLLDLFGGTGNISYEFSSRGCEDITTVELHTKCVDFIKQTSEKLALPNHKILQMDVFQFLHSCHDTFDIIFAGPPYKMPNLATLPDIIIERKLIEGQGWFILEHDPNYNFDQHPNLWRRRHYGQTNFSIFVNK